MKKLLLFSIALLLFCFGLSKGQTIPITSGVPCSNCVPNGWTKTSGSPSISNYVGEGGSVNLKWIHDVLPPPSGQNTFISLYNTTASKDAALTKITGLTAGVKYHLTYNVLSAASAKSQNEFGTSAKIRLAMGGQIPYTVAEKTLYFDAFNTASWQQQILPFTAAADYIDLHFTGTAGSNGGFVFLDIKADAVSNTCLNLSQVPLTGNSITNECPVKTVDLTSLLSGNPPPGAVVKWYTNPQHTGTAVAKPTEASAPGDYYAFYYKASEDCFNTNQSTAKVTFTRSFCCGQEGYIQLSKSEVIIACPEKTIDLNSLVITPPPGPGFKLVWFTNSIYTLGPPIADPTKAPGGIGAPIVYYAFYYNEALDCYNVAVSNAVVVVTGCCAAGDSQITLNSNSITNTCPTKTVNLNSLYSGNIPATSSLKWFNNSTHTGNAVADPTKVAVAGDYYAFIWDEFNNCYNTDNSTAKATVNLIQCACITGTDQVPVLPTLSNICPSKTADLGDAFTGNVPNLTDLVWFTSSNHAPGTKIANPNIISNPGTYYAFFYDPVNDCYNTDNSTSKTVVIINVCPPPCNAGTDQLTATPNMSNVCPAEKVNLNNSILNYIPIPGTAVRWYTTANHAPGTMVPNSAAVGSGTYYAFRYDVDNDCFNTDLSSAKTVVTINICCKAGTSQVPLSQTNAVLSCSSSKVNLNALVPSIPNGASLYWFTNAIHVPPVVMDPTSVGVGTYYAYFYDPVNLCYNTDLSIAKVVVTDNQVNVTSTLANTCPVETVNLNDALINPVFDISKPYKWFTTATHAPGTEVMNVSTASQGVYYGFKYDLINNCYNTDLSTAKVTVSIVNCFPCNVSDDPIELKGHLLSNVCPLKTVDLTSMLFGNPPSVVWFNNNTHSGVVIADPTKVAVSGTYYAFFYDAVNDCYSTDLSEADVAVSINDCVGFPPTLDLRVKLQGAMSSSGISMRTDLQNYFGANTGLLPTNDPYGFGKIYLDINNISADAGKVVDWVLVEIRNAAQPSMVLQSKVLLLRANGNVIETDGTLPVFQPESDAVQIVIKHRNHVAIMSNPIASFNGTISYDFTTDLSKAFNPPSPDNPAASTAPAQMVLVNGVWCMWAGDIDQNLTLNSDDYNTILSANGGQQGEIYMNTDINMDGGMDATDMNIIFSNNLVEPYSILSIF